MKQVRYKPPDRARRDDAEWKPPLIGGLRGAGELLEIGCRRCGRHGYYDLSAMNLRDDIPVYLAAMFLKCTTCGAQNKDERDVPIWARGDARQKSVPGRDLELRPVVDYQGTVEKPKGVGWESESEVYQIPLSEESEAALKALNLRKP